MILVIGGRSRTGQELIRLLSEAGNPVRVLTRATEQTEQTPAPVPGVETVVGDLAKPDSLWFALWDRGRNLDGGPYLPGDWWSGAHRIKQYLGPHLRTVHRRTVDIDSDRVYGLVYR